MVGANVPSLTKKVKENKEKIDGNTAEEVIIFNIFHIDPCYKRYDKIFNKLYVLGLGFFQNKFVSPRTEKTKRNGRNLF